MGLSIRFFLFNTFRRPSLVFLRNQEEKMKMKLPACRAGLPGKGHSPVKFFEQREVRCIRGIGNQRRKEGGYIEALFKTEN